MQVSRARARARATTMVNVIEVGATWKGWGERAMDRLQRVKARARDIIYDREGVNSHLDITCIGNCKGVIQMMMMMMGRARKGGVVGHVFSKVVVTMGISGAAAAAMRPPAAVLRILRGG